MSECSYKCPLVRREIREAVEEGIIKIPAKLLKNKKAVNLIKYSSTKSNSHGPTQPVIKKSKNTLYTPSSSRETNDYMINEKPSIPSQFQDPDLLIQKQDAPAKSSKIEKVSKENTKMANTSSNTNIMGALGENESCDEICPMNQNKQLLDKLEEKQRIIDHYYLTKGFGYFDDVCTCSLACIFHNLRRDPFVQSLIASVAIFTIGIKLTCELEAWYLPLPA